ncbi:MAG: hypothetical protein DLM61_14275 [Pseudonocardiales bacterium]|nr:MAG: hypothetical protein DLM61_14275 [Pseudonocardiales bacterium]
MTRGENFGRRLLVSMDAKSYGRADDQQQDAIQTGLLAVADAAAEHAGLVRSAWDRQSSGDGELAVLPLTEAEPRVVDDFVRELAAALTDHNYDLRPQSRLRLRVAIHHGVAIPAGNGYRGRGVVVVSRLVDSEPIRAALAAQNQANLAVILSKQVYTDTIVQRHTSLAHQEFRRVQVANKEFTEEAWLRLPGHDVHALDLTATAGGRRERTASEPRKPAEPTPTRPADVHIEFQREVTAPRSVFGISNRWD